ncbi:hypothetical protein NUW58_g856 [Xylaria curta]|uniref:Uncharacterized protein n=1 Tax=Xylaria curta TaxID=42375 RepID=A0ACC1PMT8_9PEZI|nr:hypothetical protein NUW58_g856 [Xylaria curta]
MPWLARTVAFAPMTTISRPISAIARLHNGAKTPLGRAWFPLGLSCRPGPLEPLVTLQRYSRNTATRASKGTTSSTHCTSRTQATLPTSLQFWASGSSWRRAAVNTSRCLVGCTSGDFSAMWLLQAFYPEIGIGAIMVMSGLTTSMLLETVLLRYGRDKLSWPNATRTAAGMSFISMLTMEMAQNVVDYHLTGGAVSFDSPAFWVAAIVSMGAGFLTPLPYNYFQLKKYGKACH